MLEGVDKLEARIMESNQVYVPDLIRQRHSRISIVNCHGRQHVLLLLIPTSDEVVQVKVANKAVLEKPIVAFEPISVCYDLHSENLSDKKKIKSTNRKQPSSTSSLRR